MRRFKGDTSNGFRDIVAAHPFFRDGFELDDRPLVAGPFSRASSRSWKGRLLSPAMRRAFSTGLAVTACPPPSSARTSAPMR